MMKRIYLIPVILLLGAGLSLAKSPELTSAKIYLNQEDQENAVEQLMLAAEAETGESEVFFLLGEISAQAGDFALMNQHFDQAAEINDKYYRKKGLKKINERRINYWVEFYNGGIRCLQEQAFQNAIDSLEIATVILPDSTIAFRHLTSSNINLAVVDPDNSDQYLLQALQHAQAVADAEPEDWTNWLTMSQIAFQLDDLENACLWAEKVLELNESEADAVKIIAFAFVRQGKREEAISYYRRALEIQPDNSILLYNMALLYQEMEDYDTALTILKQVVELTPEDSDALKLIAQTYLVHLEDPHNAIPFYERVLLLEPDNANVKINLGIALIQTETEENILRGTQLMQEGSGS
jgi:tetratricopeptide (TPR) repeat protein